VTLILVLTPLLISSNEIEKPSIKKITLNGKECYIINHSYYLEILKMHNEQLSLKQQIALLELNNENLVKLNIQLKTQVDQYLKQQQTIKIKDYVLIGSISVNVVSILGCIGLGVMSYYIWKR
jgi:hypothetical protein